MKLWRHLVSLGLAAALLAGSAAAVDPRRGPYFYGNAHYHVDGLSSEIDVGKSFARSAGILLGDSSGDMRWMEELTRAEAATILIRLMGLEEEAQAAANAPSPFTDVPAWTNGYVNLAYEKGVVNGIGNGQFGSLTLCGAQEFTLMLFRLTHLTEGTDYSWQTAMADLAQATAAVEDNSALYQYYPAFPYAAAGAYVQKYIEQEKSPFTREVAAEILYLMLSIDAGDNHESLGDILAEEYGLSDLLLYDCSVRRSAGDLAQTVTVDFSTILPRDYALLYAIQDPAFFERIRETADTNSGSIDPEVAALAQSLTQGLTSDYDKTVAVSEWIATHIFYDTDLYYARIDGRYQDPANVLKTRTAVCEGYAWLTCDMLTSVGVECYYQSSDASNHAWNIVCADGDWMAIDNTGNAGRLAFTNGTYYYKPFGGSDTPVSNYLEPNVSWGELEKSQYFDPPMDAFFLYDLHAIDRDPAVWELYLAPDRFWDPTWTGD
ncbi:transglutaminase domain-containing protein [Intestinimonas sp. HCP28S3_D6]|uniref:transglutaminase domain-containing protein n=1 Tax=Intestinimonas sp. HCP28S3_D6 TaxID=3438942 RepID=UPI003F89CDA3